MPVAPALNTLVP